MLLKKIHLSGFKSFADRITINFDKGITGVVGPNGSGKSNVIDAVRWVMGEQNAKNLRGQQATDIIFAGSAKRKALSMAEVTLVFDNSMHSSFCPAEYRHETEISLTRRLYSDGTREYLINKKPCRLKDIVGFFANTGLGGRSYSMIQQGQVERVLNAKPEQIREILEEAAGTLAFKQRRNEAQKKLDATNENLARLQDIISELERQRVALEGQVDKARKWKELSAELKTKDLELQSHNYAFFKVHTDELTTQHSEHSQAAAVLATEILELEKIQHELQSQLDNADPDLQGLHEQVSIIREDIARAENTIMNATSLLETGDQDLESLNQDIESEQENCQKLEQQHEASTQEWSAARTNAEEMQRLIDNFQSEVEAVDESAQVYENKIEDYEDQIRNIDRLLDNNSIRCESITKDQTRLVRERSSVEERVEVLRQETSGYAAEIDAARQKLSEKQTGLDGDVRRRDELQSLTMQRHDYISQTSRKRDEAKEKYFECKAKVHSLRELIANASSVQSSLAKLIELKPEAEEIQAGLLASYIKFSSEAGSLPKAAKLCFERWSERLLVQDMNAFNRLARMVNGTEISNLPVTILSQSEVRFDNGAAKIWAEKVGAEPMLPNLLVEGDAQKLAPVLNRLFYVPALELSSDDLRDMPLGVVLISAVGVLAESGFEMQVGSSESSGILSRKAELDARLEEYSQLESLLAQTQGELDDLEFKQRNESAELNEIDAKLRSQNQDVMQLMGALQTVQQQSKHKFELLESAEAQLKQFIDQYHASVQELAELGENRISLGQERSSIEIELEDIRSESSNVEERRQEVIRMHQNRKVDLAKSEVRAQSLEQSCKQLREQLERLQTGLTRRYHELSKLREDLEMARTNSAKAHEDMQTLIYRREQLEEELTAKRQENAGIIEQLRGTDDKLKTAREKSFAVEKKISHASLELERAKIGLAAAVQQVAEKYHEDLSQLNIVVPEDFNADKTSRQISRLRNQIEDLGAINMMAIEEYDALQTREEFIFAQREEVNSSIMLLAEAIDEMDQTSKYRFLETFEQVNREFGGLFPILFPGGDAKLQMTNPDDALNTGVDIMVRLPGKKQQNMSLFSGGEKALTAISLIFALLKSKPTPFCFLDEVDAPLDEANVGRYNRVLEALSDRFQFIVITHNRRTMEVLDTLYGVTMQEPGVSKVVGVDLAKDLPDHLKKAFKENKAKANEAGAPAVAPTVSEPTASM